MLAYWPRPKWQTPARHGGEGCSDDCELEDPGCTGDDCGGNGGPEDLGGGCGCESSNGGGGGLFVLLVAFFAWWRFRRPTGEIG